MVLLTVIIEYENLLEILYLFVQIALNFSLKNQTTTTTTKQLYENTIWIEKNWIEQLRKQSPCFTSGVLLSFFFRAFKFVNFKQENQHTHQQHLQKMHHISLKYISESQYLLIGNNNCDYTSHASESISGQTKTDER